MMMLLVRVSTENRTGTNEVSSSAEGNRGPTAVLTDDGISVLSITASEFASAFTTVYTLIWATAERMSSCAIKASTNSMLSGGPVIIRELVRTSGMASTSVSRPDLANRLPSTPNNSNAEVACCVVPPRAVRISIPKRLRHVAGQGVFQADNFGLLGRGYVVRVEFFD